MIVEDYADDVFLIRRFLSRLPMEINTTHIEDGREAIRMSEKWEPLDAYFDLVLLDSRLQGESGLEVLQALRRSDPNGSVPIVLLIGAAGDDFSEIAMGYGADACVVKPLDPDLFAAKLTRIADTWLTKS